MPTARRRAPIAVAGDTVSAGSRVRLELPVARLPTQTMVSLPIEVVHGRKPGPTLWLSAAIHGDEANGLEIIRRVLAKIDPQNLRGTVLAVPIVNVFGFLAQSRYLPDRRDLNRCFPGSARGSLAARLAHLFMTEVVAHCSHGIDLHTASNNRDNLPQIRADLNDAETRACAEAFRAPATLHSRTRDGSLREAASRLGKAVLLYEAGEPNRFNQTAIRAGVAGVLRVMAHLGMRVTKAPALRSIRTFWASSWVRARSSGIFRRKVELGDMVKKGQALGVIGDAFGASEHILKATQSGQVIGLSLSPLVNQGDALAHIGHKQQDPSAETP